MRRLLMSAMCVLMTLHASLHAQPTTQPAAIDVGHGCVLEVPATCMRAPELVVQQGFFARGQSQLDAVFHPRGSRPTDLPYAILESSPYPMFPVRTADEQQELADQIASYYATAIRSPSKADRLAAWKRAKVSAVTIDPKTRRFHFTATIAFDDAPERTLDVVGVFAPSAVKTLSTWADTDTLAKHGPDLAALRNSFRLGTPPVIVTTAQERLLRTARIGGVLLILLIVGVQGYVLWRERRERSALP